MPLLNQTDFGLVTVVPSSPPSPAPPVSDIPEFWGIVPIVESRKKQGAKKIEKLHDCDRDLCLDKSAKELQIQITPSIGTAQPSWIAR